MEGVLDMTGNVGTMVDSSSIDSVPLWIFIIHSSPCLIFPQCSLSFASGPNQKIYYKKTKTNKKTTLFKCDWVYLQIRHPHSLGQSIWILWPFNHTGPRIKPATHKSAKSNPGFLSARKQHFWKLQNPKHCSFIQFLSSSAAFLTPFCVRGNKCGFITHAAQNI